MSKIVKFNFLYLLLFILCELSFAGNSDGFYSTCHRKFMFDEACRPVKDAYTVDGDSHTFNVYTITYNYENSPMIGEDIILGNAFNAEGTIPGTVLKFEIEDLRTESQIRLRDSETGKSITTKTIAKDFEKFNQGVTSLRVQHDKLLINLNCKFVYGRFHCNARYCPDGHNESYIKHLYDDSPQESVPGTGGFTADRMLGTRQQFYVSGLNSGNSVTLAFGDQELPLVVTQRKNLPAGLCQEPSCANEQSKMDSLEGVGAYFTYRVSSSVSGGRPLGSINGKNITSVLIQRKGSISADPLCVFNSDISRCSVPDSEAVKVTPVEEWVLNLEKQIVQYPVLPWGYDHATGVAPLLVAIGAIVVGSYVYDSIAREIPGGFRVFIELTGL